MSKGSRIFPIRIPAEMVKEIDRELQARRDARAMRPISFSEWVRQAIKEKIAHAKRSRGKARKPLLTPQDIEADLETKGFCGP